MSKTEKLSHYAVVFIAVFAVIVSIWQVRISQQHNRLSVRPFMDFFYGWNAENHFQLEIFNHGVGPAIITKVEYWSGRTQYDSWDEVLKATNLLEKRTNSYTYSSNSAFAANNEELLLELKINETEQQLIRPLKIIIHYESIYEEPFEMVIDL